MRRIVRNRAFDLLRYQGRRPAELSPGGAPLDRIAADDTAMDATEAMTTKLAIALINSLPREQAEAVLLRAVVGLDARTAADVLGKSPAAVRVAAHRGLKGLAKQLGSRPEALPRTGGGAR